MVFVAGAIFGIHMMFDDIFELGASSVKVTNAIYAEKSTTEMINAIVKTMDNLPLVANTIEHLNWGYLQWSFLIFFFLAIALIAWPSEKEEGDEVL